MLIALHNIKGKTLFENDNFYLCLIEETGVDNSQSSEQILDAILSLPVGSHVRAKEFFAPRFSQFLFVGKNHMNFVVTTADLAEIEQQSLAAKMGDALPSVFNVLKSSKGKSSTLDVRPLLLTGSLNAQDDFVLAHAEVSAYAASYTFSPSKDGKFTLRASTGGNKSGPGRKSEEKANGIYLINEFESVFVPLKQGENQDEVVRMLNKVRERAELPGRISGTYLTFPTSREGRMQIRINSLPDMKVQEMLRYFGHSKSAESKVSTLNDCLGTLAKRHLPVLETGDTLFIQIGTRDVEDLPYEVLPMDYLLCRAAHLRILSCQQPKPDTVRCIVQVSEKPVDDFATALYNLQDTQGKSVKFVAFPQAKLDELVRKIAAKLEEGTPA